MSGCVATAAGAVVGTAASVTAAGVKGAGKVAGATVGAAGSVVHHKSKDSDD
jgi:hypothetical protein